VCPCQAESAEPSAFTCHSPVVASRMDWPTTSFTEVAAAVVGGHACIAGWSLAHASSRQGTEGRGGAGPPARNEIRSSAA